MARLACSILEIIETMRKHNVLSAADPAAKVIAFKRFSLAD